ncbi:MAG: STAS domain-containing protein [Phycisphaerales bacterium]|nr:STAS domain-containing protein [Phycisphaerales bacterium]
MSTPSESSSTGTSLFVNFEQDGKVLIARMVGPNVGQREAEIITSGFQRALEADSGSTHLHMDMAEVAFMNSMGIGMLVDLRNKTTAKKMKLVLGGVRPELEQLLKMVRLDKLFKLCTNDKQLEKALKR